MKVRIRRTSRTVTRRRTTVSSSIRVKRTIRLTTKSRVSLRRR